MPTIIVGERSLQLNGKNVAIEIVTNVAQSSLLLTGHTPSRGVGLILRGYAPEISFFDKALPSADHLIFTRYVPFPFNEFNRTPSIDALTLTGYAPTTIEISVREPAAATLDIDSDAFTVSTPDARVAVPDEDQLVLFGEAPLVILGIGVVIGPPRGLISFDSDLTTINRTENFWLDPLLGTLTIAGQAPFDVGSKVIVPSGGALALATYVPETVLSGVFVTPVGGISFTTKANFVAADQLVLAIAGYVPGRITNNIYIVPEGGLSCEPHAPQTETEGIKAVNTYLATLTGQAPTLAFSSFFQDGKGGIVSLTTDRDVISIGNPFDTIVS